MADKELSHQESALLFINNLQNELAKANLSAEGHRSQKSPQEMPPPQQIRRLQNPKGDPHSKHRTRSMI
jgi:hypothetical protein